MATIVIQHIKFDVVDYIRKLRNANFTQEQAETLAQETEQVVSNVIEQTQQVVEGKELLTKKDLELTKLEIQRDAHSSKLQIIVWIGIFFLTNGILAHFLK